MYDRTFWKDKVTQFPNRYAETDEGGGLKTLEPAPGTVIQAGTGFSQEKMNNQEMGISTLHAAVLFLLQQFRLFKTWITAKATTVTLPTSGWSGTGPYTYTATVASVTATNLVLAGPAPASKADYEDCGAYASAQGAGTLTFTAKSVPTTAITVNVATYNL